MQKRKQYLLLSTALLSLFLTASLSAQDAPKDGANQTKSVNGEDLHAITGRAGHIGLSRGVIGKCREGQKASIEDVTKQLRDRFNVRVAKAEEKDRDSLIYLLAYFDVMRFRFREPLSLEFSSRSGPRYVEKDGNRLTVLSGAAEKTFTARLNKALEKAPEAEELTLEFTNTLFEQLTMALSDADFVNHVLKEHFDIDTHPSVSKEMQKYSREVTHQEATLLLKQLLDLPAWMTGQMHVKGVVRMQPGFSEGAAAADYNPKSGIIRLFDGAFKEGISSGEGTLLHELGHGFWARMQGPDKERFKDLSWEAFGGKHRIRSGRTNFVSDYARSSFEEDFAESFSAFVHRPEWLRRQAPDKYAYFRDLIRDSEYFSAGHNNTRLKIESARPDTTAPRFDGKIEDLISLYAKELKETNEVEIRCVASRVFDDISGVSGLSFCFRDPGRPSSKSHYIFMGSDNCIDPKNGVYEGKTRIRRDELTPKSKLEMTHLYLKDKAGNDVRFDPHGISIPVDGSYNRQQRDKSSLVSNLEKVKITALPPEPGKEPTYRVFLPLTTAEVKEVGRLQLYWAVPERNKEASVHVWNEIPATARRDNPSGIEMDVFFPKYFVPGQARLTQINLTMGKTAKLDEHTDHINVPNDLQNTRVEIRPTASDRTMPKFDSNEIKARIESEEVGKKGPRITFSVPVGNIDAAKGNRAYVGIRLRSPTGNSLYFPGEGTIREVGGQQVMTFVVDLPPNPERGTYLIEEVSLGNLQPSAGTGVGRAIPTQEGYGHYQQVNERLLERGIRRSFTISP